MRVVLWLRKQATDPGFIGFMKKLEEQKDNLTKSVINSEDEQPLKRGRIQGIDWVLKLPDNLTKDSTNDET